MLCNYIIYCYRYIYKDTTGNKMLPTTNTATATNTTTIAAITTTNATTLFSLQ